MEKITATQRFECTGHSGPIYTLCAGVESGTIFSAGSDKVVACWNTLTGKQTGLTIKTDAPVFSLCPIPEKKILLVGLNNGSIHVIDTVEKKEIRHLKYHSSSVFAVAYDEKNNQIYSSDANGNLVVTNATDFSLMLTLPFGEIRIRGLHCKNDVILLARGDGKITGLETKHFNELFTFQAHDMGCNTVWVDDNGNLYSGGKDAWLKKWHEQEYVIGWPAHTAGIYDLTYIPELSILVSASRDKTIKCWHPGTLEPLLRIERKNHKGHLHSVNKLCWEPHSGLLWSAGDDRRILGWELRIS